MDRCFDLEKYSFINTAYHLTGTDPHLRKNHSHEGFEIIQIWSDEGYVLIKDKVYPMLKGAIYIINGIESHSTNPINEKNYTRSKITFSSSYISKIIEFMEDSYLLNPFLSNTNANYMLTPLPEICDRVDKIFNEITQEVNNDLAGKSAYITSCIIQLLTIIYRIASQNDNASAQNTFSNQRHILSIIGYINTNLSKNFVLDEMCEYLYLNKFYACHLFKKVTGMTIFQYIIERRISEAKKLLSLTDMAISDIAMSTGFSSFSLFSRTFSRLTGFTPMQYRKR